MTTTHEPTSEELRYEPIRDTMPTVVLVPYPFEQLTLPVIEL